MLNMVLSEMEPILDCVNPHDVNPITIGGNVENSPNEDISKTSIKLEMEEFSDLAPYLPEKAIQSAQLNITDELNTPIFDRKGPFDFPVFENTCVQSTTTGTTATSEDPFKFEYEFIRMDTTNNSVLSNKQQNDFSVYTNELNIERGIVNNSEIVTTCIQNTESNNNNNNLLFTTSNIMDQGNIFIINNNLNNNNIDNGNETPIHMQISKDHHISASSNNYNLQTEDMNNSVSVQNANISSPMKSEPSPQYTDITSPSNDVYQNFNFETPENSNSGSDEHSDKPPKLTLSLSFLNHQTPIMNTPDVIDSVVDLETTFNVFGGFDDDKEITTINVEDIQFDPSGSGASTFADIINNMPTTTTAEPTILRIRKKRRYEDDDEDYVPPVKKSKAVPITTTTTKRRIIEEEENSDDSDSEYEPTTYNKTKSKRSYTKQVSRRTSISSDHSDASKYRELRDKNNEASRKSRLKRKMKEMTLEKEAEELGEKNIKLKAQVEELEKMVNNFRNNLFKIMLKK